MTKPFLGVVLAAGILAAATVSVRAADGTLATRHLLEAVLRNDIAGVRGAIADGADLSGKNARGATASEIAVDLGHIEIANYLLALTQIRNGETPPTLPTNLPPIAAERADSRTAGADGTSEPAPAKAPVHFPLPPEKPAARTAAAPEAAPQPPASVLAETATAAAPATAAVKPTAKRDDIDAPYDPSRYLQGLTSKPAKNDETASESRLAALPVTPLPARDADALASRAAPPPAPTAKRSAPPASAQPSETTEKAEPREVPAVPAPKPTAPAPADAAATMPPIEIPEPLPSEPKPTAEISSSVPPLLPPPSPPARDDTLESPTPSVPPRKPSVASDQAPPPDTADRIVEALANRASGRTAATVAQERPPEAPSDNDPIARMAERMQEAVSSSKDTPPASTAKSPDKTAAAVEPPPAERPDWSAAPLPAAAEPAKPSTADAAKPAPEKKAAAAARPRTDGASQEGGFFNRLFGTITDLNPFAARRDAEAPKPEPKSARDKSRDTTPAPARNTGPALPPPTALIERREAEKRERAAEKTAAGRSENRPMPPAPKPAEPKAVAEKKDDALIRDPRALGDENAYRSKNMFQRLAEWLEGKDDGKPRFKPLPAELLQEERAAARATQRAIRDERAAQQQAPTGGTSWSPTVEKAGEEPQLAEAEPKTAKPSGAAWAPMVEKSAPGTQTQAPAGSLFGLGGSAPPAPKIEGPAVAEESSGAPGASPPGLFGMSAKPSDKEQQQAALPPAEGGGLFGIGSGAPAKDAKPPAASGQPWNVTSVEQADQKPPLVRAEPTPAPALPAGVGFAVGNALTLGKIPPEMTAETEKGRSCIEKHNIGVAFCIEPALWPKTVEPAFVVSTILYTGPMAIVRYDGGVATRMQALFPSEEYEKVVAYFNQRYGQPSEYWTRSIAPLAAARRDNPTQAWRARHPKTGEVMTLEVRQYDDTRGGFPDTKRGVVMLYVNDAKPIFPQVSSLELMRLRRQR